MIRITFLVVCCILLTSCEALKNIREDSALNSAGSFELNPVRPNSYWYDGKSYEYNQYEIEITAEPVRADVQWNGEAIGTTPFIYRFSGVLDKGDYVRVRMVPLHKEMAAQEAVLHVMTELPRKIHFDLRNKKERADKK